MYSFIHFGLCIHLWHQRCNENNELVLHPKSFLRPLCNPALPPFPVPREERMLCDRFAFSHIQYFHFLEFHINRIREYVLFFFFWFLSPSAIILRLIHVVACINSLFIFVAHWYHTICIYCSCLFIWCTFELFPVLGYFKYSSMNIHVWIFV